MTTKCEAIQELENDGHLNAAEDLRSYKDKNGRNYGWDGWLRHMYLEHWLRLINRS